MLGLLWHPELPLPRSGSSRKPLTGLGGGTPCQTPSQGGIGIPQWPAVLDVRHGLLSHHAAACCDSQHGVNSKILSLFSPQVRHAALVHPLVLLFHLGQAEAVGDGIALDSDSLKSRQRERRKPHKNLANILITAGL